MKEEKGGTMNNFVGTKSAVMPKKNEEELHLEVLDHYFNLYSSKTSYELSIIVSNLKKQLWVTMVALKKAGIDTYVKCANVELEMLRKQYEELSLKYGVASRVQRENKACLR